MISYLQQLRFQDPNQQLAGGDGRWVPNLCFDFGLRDEQHHSFSTCVAGAEERPQSALWVEVTRIESPRTNVAEPRYPRNLQNQTGFVPEAQTT